MMKTLRDVPVREVPVVEPQTPLDEVVRLMEAEPLRTVALVGDQMYMGLFNDDALESELIPTGADLSLLTVGPYVHPSRVIGEPDMPVDVVLALMTRKHQDVIPVIDNVTFRGVVTRQDLEAA
jgi:CBS domain-containing protein